MTLSARAIASLDGMAMNGLRVALAGRADEVTRLAAVPDLADVADTRAVMLSVALVECRMVLFIYFSPNDATRAHFAALHGKNLSELDEQAFLDALSECGNIACGTMNRDLGQVFTHLGMSTPALVDSQCARHLGLLRHAYPRHYALELNAHTVFHATLCICPYAPLDFSFESQVETASSGELEMF